MSNTLPAWISVVLEVFVVSSLQLPPGIVFFLTSVTDCGFRSFPDGIHPYPEGRERLTEEVATPDGQVAV